MSRCRSCKAPVWWVKTTAGRFTPVDAEDMGGYEAPLVNVDAAGLRVTGDRAPDGRGGMVPVVEALVGLELAAEPEEGERRYRSHFVTCPHAGEHRKPKGRASR